MDYVNLKEMRLSHIVLGTDRYSDRIDRETAFALMDFYTAHGGNVIDTARMYCGGETEKLVGEWLRSRRAAVYVSTKCSHPPLDDMTHSRLSKADIESDLDESLRALGVERVDVLWLHRDDVHLPVGPIVDALNEMVRKGKTRYFGASNWSFARIAEANRYAAESGQAGFCASQAHYNMAYLAHLHDPTLAVVQGEEKRRYDESGFPVFAFCSQAKGFFEKYAAGTLSGKAKERFYNETTLETYRAIKARADERGDTLSHTALQMLIEQSAFPVFPIIGPSGLEQLRATLNLH